MAYRFQLIEGQTLGRYRVEKKLGQGGMGAVYKAQDTVLRRAVALKVLHARCFNDSESRQRLMQEARAVSALAHPNIVTVHDVGQTDDIDFIAMEYLAGKTLDQMIPCKGLRLDEALQYAIPVADALVAAHAAGIIHRDIKPSNIVVTDQGVVKVLDFGLAKQTKPGERAPEDSTQRAVATSAEGMILGTAAYMSPEQAEGKRVDARSDIFSFGAVLYEMVTGRRAFPGDTPMAAMAAILHQEPGALGVEVPRDLERMIARCLRKDPARRSQHMADVKVVLEELREQLASAKVPAARPAPRPRRLWLWAVMACCCGAVLLALWLTVFSRMAPPASFTVVPLTTYPGNECCPSLSPDGNQVAFAWNGDKQDNYDIYVQVIGSGRPLRLTTHPAEDVNPAWSPDGRYIAFRRRVSDKNSIVLIPPLGGTERVLGETGPFGLAWTPDSRYIAYAEATAPGKDAGISILSIETGEKRRLTTPRGFFYDVWPAFSPDGRALAFARWGEPTGEVYLVPLSDAFQPTGEPRQLSWEKQYAFNPTWSADGRDVIYTAGHDLARTLRRIRADRVLSGGFPGPAKAEMLTLPGDTIASFSVSGARRRLVYAKVSIDLDIMRIDLDERERNPAARPFITSTRNELSPEFSPDGKRIAFASDRSGSYEVWVSNLDGSGLEKLTSMQAPITGPARWSPDGKWIVFGSNAAGQFELYVVAANGGGLRRLTHHPASDKAASWSHDGRWIYFTSDRTGQPQVWRMPAEGGDALQITKGGGNEPLESPDGKTLYYSKDNVPESIWKVPVGGGEETRILDAVKPFSFTVTGRGIYFVKPPDDATGGLSIQLMDFPTGASRLIKAIDKLNYGGVAVSPDYRTILYTQFERRGGDLMLVENFQ
ncbi:MAG: PD40 domain-containing protein [Bryobacterales bacterium]|nr:PD40 domain-containing protein [Bryobacterales bacterium]